MHPTEVRGDSTAEERDLVRRMRAGDEKAFEQFASHYVPGLYRFVAARAGRHQDLVAETVQTAVCRFIEKLDTYRGDAALFTWLCTVARNEIAGHFRKRENRSVTVNVEDADVRAADNPERELLAHETGNLVHIALDHLPPNYARALEWKYNDGLSVREIASRLELGEKATESLLTRARSAFRVAYEELQ